MGLITKEVEVYVSGKTYRHYDNLGYEFPRKPNGKCDLTVPFRVKVEDLTPKSAAKVELECDGCGKKSVSKYYDYVNHNHNGKTYCMDCARKILLSGENHPNYNPNKTNEEREKGRCYPKYIEFIRKVLARDNYTCQCCGQKYGDLEVHHLNGYNWYKEGRIDETNAITLCHNCHTNFHAMYGNKHSTKEEFEEWLGKSIELIKCGIEILPCKKIYCIETNAVYNSVNEMCMKLEISHTSRIYNICNRKAKHKSANGYHFLWYDDYLNMSKNDIDEYLYYCNTDEKWRKIICLETNEIFKRPYDAGKKYNSNNPNASSNIIRACNDLSKTAYTYGNLRLHWMYYDEYITKTPEEIYNIKHTFGEARPIICLSYNIVYKNATEAAKECGIKISNVSIISACKRKFGQTGKLSNQHKLTWMYYDLFVELSTEEQKRILEKYSESLYINDSFII